MNTGLTGHLKHKKLNNMEKTKLANCLIERTIVDIKVLVSNTGRTCFDELFCNKGVKPSDIKDDKLFYYVIACLIIDFLDDLAYLEAFNIICETVYKMETKELSNDVELFFKLIKD